MRYMTERYDADFRFRKENITDEEYEELIEQFERIDQVEIETRQKDLQEALLSDPATFIELTAVSLTVHGTDILISLYQIARDYPSFAHANIRDENGEKIEEVDRTVVDTGAVEESAIIGHVEGDLTLVLASDIDYGKVAKAGTGFKDREE